MDTVQAEERGPGVTGGIDRRSGREERRVERSNRLDGVESCRVDRRSRRTGRGRGTQSGQEE